MGIGLVVILPLLWKGILGQVTYAPGYSIQVSPSVRVQEGLCVTIPCTFTADGRNRFNNSFGYWRQTSGYIVATNDKSSDVQKPNFNLTGNPDTGDCTLTITGARKEDVGEYFFRFEESKVKYNYYREMTTNIIVTDLTEEPVISNLGTLTAGIDKTVTCAPPGNCPVTSLVIQWKKSDVSGIWKNSSTITFTPSLDDHQKNITCEVTNSRGNTTKISILLEVSSAPLKTGGLHLYWYIAVVSICVISIITAIILMYKFIIRKKMAKMKTFASKKEMSGSTEPATVETYVNASKDVKKAEKATNNKIQQDSSGITLDQNDLLYSTVAFTSKSAKMTSHQPETEYAEIHLK